MNVELKIFESPRPLPLVLNLSASRLPTKARSARARHSRVRPIRAGCAGKRAGQAHIFNRFIISPEPLAKPVSFGNQV